MTDLHERFTAWLADGAAGDPPRDLALHAAGCRACLARADGIDALGRVDLGAAPVPPALAVDDPSAGGFVRIARAAAAVSALGLVAAAAIIGSGELLSAREAAPDGAALVQPTPAEGVMGAAFSPEATSSAADTERPTADASPSPSEDPAAEPTAEPEASSPAPGPVTPGPTTQPPTTQPTSPPGAGSPIPAPTATQSQAGTQTPAASPTPTAPPPPTPTPEPTATPTPDPMPTPTPTPTESEEPGG